MLEIVKNRIQVRTAKKKKKVRKKEETAEKELQWLALRNLVIDQLDELKRKEKNISAFSL